MDEQEQVTPSPDTETWDDEPILPDAEPDAETPSDADTPSESGPQGLPGPQGPETPEPEPPKAEETQSEPEPDYKALYEGEKDRQNAEKFRQVYQEQLGLTGNESLARMIARNECGGKDYPLEDASDAPETPSNDFRSALTELQSLYPDATEMPENVMREFMGGKSLKDAYSAHRAKQDAETIADLRREIAALKQDASNRAAAPVKGSRGAAPEQTDPFLKGFDAEW